MTNVNPVPTVSTPFLSDAWYNRLKWVAQILLPALGTLYFALAGSLGLPAAEQVVGTVLAVDTFLGALLGLSSRQYNNSDAKYDGSLFVASNDHRLIHKLEITTEPEDLGSQKEIVLKVEQGGPVDKTALEKELEEEL